MFRCFRCRSVGRFFTCALSAATRRRSAQPQLAPTAARKAGARWRKASAQEPQTTHRSGTSSAGGSQRGGPVSDYKGQGARGSTCRGGYDAAWSLIERAHGGKREPIPGFCLCGRTEAARRVPRGRSKPAPGAGFFRPLAARAGAARGASSRAPAVVTAKRAWWWWWHWHLPG